jgi:hypothetical protein
MMAEHRSEGVFDIRRAAETQSQRQKCAENKNSPGWGVFELRGS